jgi:hypothetical protein
MFNKHVPIINQSIFFVQDVKDCSRRVKKTGEVCSILRNFVHTSSVKIGDRAFRF